MSEGELPVHEVLIVGGGIAGLGAAIALGRRGVRTTVVERGDGAVGASIGIGERGVYALEELGLLEQAKQQGRPVWLDELPPYTQWAPDGRQLGASMPEHAEDWTLPIEIRIYRPVLAQIMRQAAVEHGAEVLLGHSYRALDVTEDKVVAELSTGERREFDLLIAADGVHSELRARFFPDAGDPVYTGSMSFRVMLEGAPDDWRSGRHIKGPLGVQTALLRDNLFYFALPSFMERRQVDQDEAREIVRQTIDQYSPSEMFDALRARLEHDFNVIVAPFEWIFVEPPWHQGRVVLIGDAAHATAPTIGMAGGMALEDTVVLAQELAGAGDLDQGLRAYATRRRDRTKLVVETSATLMRTHQERRTPAEEWEIRMTALRQLVAPY